eukprot:gene25451-7565_t
MKIAVGSFKQETNDFSSVPTTRQTFEDFSVLVGKEVVDKADNLSAPELKAFLDEVAKWAVPSTVLPLAEIGSMLPANKSIASCLSLENGMMIQKAQSLLQRDF